MIKEAIEKILGLAPPNVLTFEGREYTDKQIYPVRASLPEALGVNTLTGILDYISVHIKDDLENEHPFLQVVSHKEVRLSTNLQGPFQQRAVFMVAEPPENGSFRFGQWMETENFIIALQAHFVQDEVTAQLLALVSSIKEEAVRTSQDDGVSQTVTAREGAALVTTVKVPNPVILRPYRTFMEVTQPAISCVFRLQKGPLLSLHEADGGLWRLQAIQSIKEYLVTELEKLGQKIPVIA